MSLEMAPILAPNLDKNLYFFFFFISKGGLRRGIWLSYITWIGLKIIAKFELANEDCRTLGLKGIAILKCERSGTIHFHSTV